MCDKAKKSRTALGPVDTAATADKNPRFSLLRTQTVQFQMNTTVHVGETYEISSSEVMNFVFIRVWFLFNWNFSEVRDVPIKLPFLIHFQHKLFSVMKFTWLSLNLSLWSTEEPSRTQSKPHTGCSSGMAAKAANLNFIGNGMKQTIS